MTIAEVHGKLADSKLHERLEDLLTSDIFGPLRYLEDGAAALLLLADALLTDWSGATLAAHTAVRPLLGAQPAPRPDVHFWPNLAHCQPDVLITWPLPDGGRLVLMVEVKYLSGKSGEGTMEQEDGEALVVDQLGREYRDLCTLLRPGDTGALVFLTTDPKRPEESIKQSLSTMRLRPEAALYWLGWKRVYAAIRRLEGAADQPHVQAVWNDMRRLLERKRLTGLSPWAQVLAAPNAPTGPWYQARRATRHWDWPAAQPPDVLSWYGVRPAATYDWTGIGAGQLEIWQYGRRSG